MALCPGSIMASGIINETSATNLGQGVVTRPVPSQMSEMFARHCIHTSCKSAFLLADISVYADLASIVKSEQKRQAFAPRGGSVPDSSIDPSSIFQLKRRTPTDRTSTTLFKTCFAGGFHSTGRPFDAMSYTRLPVSG
ncbi:hypothetical protein ALC56_03065 [Trachymyrmex septentrionalis]|uniref:Uncharacterized protein n=1 Tax=Trachymyrmex septentrionalis TaxID=34720 RepID=A0A195FRI1_9HYME|nr:hypothetical protein ALC56_03065 [Trachymyrmex septentrionalis]